MIVDVNPELWTTGERWNAGHKGWESVVGAEKDVLGRPRIVAADEAGCLGGMSVVWSSRAQLAV